MPIFSRNPKEVNNEVWTAELVKTGPYKALIQTNVSDGFTAPQTRKDLEGYVESVSTTVIAARKASEEAKKQLNKVVEDLDPDNNNNVHNIFYSKKSEYQQSSKSLDWLLACLEKSCKNIVKDGVTYHNQQWIAYKEAVRLQREEPTVDHHTDVAKAAKDVIGEDCRIYPNANKEEFLELIHPTHAVVDNDEPVLQQLEINTFLNRQGTPLSTAYAGLLSPLVKKINALRTEKHALETKLQELKNSSENKDIKEDIELARLLDNPAVVASDEAIELTPLQKLNKAKKQEEIDEIAKKITLWEDALANRLVAINGQHEYLAEAARLQLEKATAEAEVKEAKKDLSALKKDFEAVSAPLNTAKRTFGASLGDIDKQGITFKIMHDHTTGQAILVAYNSSGGPVGVGTPPSNGNTASQYKQASVLVRAFMSTLVSAEDLKKDKFTVTVGGGKRTQIGMSIIQFELLQNHEAFQKNDGSSIMQIDVPNASFYDRGEDAQNPRHQGFAEQRMSVAKHNARVQLVMDLAAAVFSPNDPIHKVAGAETAINQLRDTLATKFDITNEGDLKKLKKDMFGEVEARASRFKSDPSDGFMAKEDKYQELCKDKDSGLLTVFLSQRKEMETQLDVLVTEKRSINTAALQAGNIKDAETQKELPRRNTIS